MRSRSYVLSLALFATTFVAPAAAQQFTVSGRAATVTVGGRFHYQYAHSSMDAAANDFFMKRARPNLDLAIGDFLNARIETEFAGGSVLRDAWVRFNFADEFLLSVGQIKRGFDIFMLASSVDLSLIERDGRIEGYSTCSGVGSVCTYARLLEALQYSDRDMGIRVEGASGRASWYATFTNGTGFNTADENDKKSVAARLTLALTEDIRISPNVSTHDYVGPSGDETAVAFGGDVEFGTWRDGVHLQAAAVTGDNWEILDPVSEDPASFLTFQAALSYFLPIEGGRVSGIEPLGRVSFADPDTDTDDDGALLLTPGFMVYVGGRNKIGANLDLLMPQVGDSEFSLKIQTFLYY